MPVCENTVLDLSVVRSQLQYLRQSFERQMLAVLRIALKDPDPDVRRRSAAILIAWRSFNAMELLYAEVSKYDVPAASVDCPTGIRAGCGVFCCRAMFARITLEDLADGIEEHPGMPGFARFTRHGCYALDPKTNRCTVWEKRPITCRIFNCKTDPRFAHLMKW